MAGAFVHQRQVGNLVFNDQLVSLRFTFQSPPFHPQLTSPKLCLISSSCAPGNRDSLPCSFLEKLSRSSSLFIGIGIKKKEMENLLKPAQWNNISKEKANVYYVWMGLSYVCKHKLRGGELFSRMLWYWPHSSTSADSRDFKAFVPTVRMGLKKCISERIIQNAEADESNLSSLKRDRGKWQLPKSLPQISKEKWVISGYSSSG